MIEGSSDWTVVFQWLTTLASYAPPLVVGVVAGLVALGAQRAGQWWIDHRTSWPFRVRVSGRVNRAFPRYQARVRVYNRASTTAHVNLTPRDPGDAVVNGWQVKDPWGYHDAGMLVPVRPREWAEFWLEGPNGSEGSPPTRIHFEAWFFTDESARTKSVEIAYSG